MVSSPPAASCAHLRSLALWLCATTTAATAQSPFECDLFVTEESPSRVWTHHGITGAPTGPAFASESAPRFFMAIHHGTVAQPVLVGTFGNGVFEYQRNTGAYIKTYNVSSDWQWAGLFAPNGEVLIGNQSSDDVRRYDPVTGALLGVFAPNVVDPADMVFGPNGNLFVCSYESTIGGVYELHGATGAFVALHAAGVVKRANDLVFLPDGRRIVISSHPSSLLAFVFDASWNLQTSFTGTGWLRPHGIDISPYDSHIYISDGGTNAVHRFDPTTYVETHAAFAFRESKIVDVEFRRGGTPICGNVLEVAPGCGGLMIEHTGRPQLASMLTLRMIGARPFAPVFLSVGESRTQWNGLPLPLPLTSLGAPSCSVLTSPLLFLPTAADLRGHAEMPLVAPNDGALVGATIFFQWYVLDALVNPLGLATSSGYEVRIGT